MGATAVIGGLMVGGTLAQAQGSRTAGSMAQRGANLEAAQMEKAAGQDVAASQRNAAEESRVSRLLQSRALAVAAANGGASDPTVVNIISDLAGEGAYRQALALYGGEQQKENLETGAAAKRYEGVVAKGVGDIQATNQLIEGFGKIAFGSYGSGGLYAKYGAGGFGKNGGKTAPSAGYAGQG